MRFMLHCDPEVGWVSWRSIWSHCQFSYSCIWANVVCGLAAPSQTAQSACYGHATSLVWTQQSLGKTSAA